MNAMQIIEGHMHNNAHHKIAIVMSRFNSFITDSLLKGALESLKRHGVVASEITVIRVPGALEIPLAVQNIAAQKKHAGILALGCVIRGATSHYDHVCSESIKGVQQVSLQHNIPVAVGILTTETIEQAIERAGTKAGNKGAEAACTLLEMIDIVGKLNNEKA